jgi:putative two-component system response regulator
MISENRQSQSFTAERSRPARILVVDDEPLSVKIICRVLEAAGHAGVVSTMDPLDAVSLIRFSAPDLVILDLHMPGFDGFELLQSMTAVIPDGDFIPVLVITGDMITDTRRTALKLGATDFLTKPFDNSELVLRIANMLKARRLHLALIEQREELKRSLFVRDGELEEARLEILEALAHAAELRDPETGRHMRTVGEISGKLAAAVGLDSNTARMIGRVAPLHDIGKIGVPDGTLLKRGPLSEQQLHLMRDHTIIGERLLSSISSPMLRTAASIARHHHERWDGSGYPDGLRGDAIPLAARIVAVADVFDALIHDRPYRTAWTEAAAIELILAGSGTHFDPEVVDAFASFGWVAAHAEEQVTCMA